MRCTQIVLLFLGNVQPREFKNRRASRPTRVLSFELSVVPHQGRYKLTFTKQGRCNL